jgi:hypothetical protein
MNTVNIQLKIRLGLDLVYNIIGKPNEEHRTNQIIEDYFDTFVQIDLFIAQN